jgi:hypothetical protein
MDEIQKVLIKAGRKDLAQKYYLKIAKKQDKKAWIIWDLENNLQQLMRYLGKNFKAMEIKVKQKGHSFLFDVDGSKYLVEDGYVEPLGAA